MQRRNPRTRTWPRPADWPRGCAWLRAGLALVALAWPLRAPALDELPLKAAIIFNLLQFVEWPAEAEPTPTAPLLMCADRAAPLWPHLQLLEQRLVRQRRLELRDAATTDALRGCQAWVLEDGVARLPATRVGPGMPVLTIGDGARADEAGVVIALRSIGQRQMFDINMELARQLRLQLSSKVLRLARVVRE
ncbi:MAG: YfiR family protein [Burkholderiales bacterium]|nr:YfiR family protein [Burkholderiales bacterium]